MPYRRQILATGEFYHVFNRTANAEKIFIYPKEMNRALKLLNYYRFHSDFSFSHVMRIMEEMKTIILERIYASDPLVEIIAFSMMPTHFHLVLKQLQKDGIRQFVTNFQNSYAKYINLKHDRQGPVFYNRFKAVMIESHEQLIHSVRYAELNPVTSHIIDIEDLDNYPYTSFSTYMGNYTQQFISKEIMMNYFKTREKYKKFVYDQSDYQRNLKKIKDIVLD